MHHGAGPRDALFESARLRADLTVEQLWLRYLALTGRSDVFEVDAFLNGLTEMPVGEQDILACALNERLIDLRLSGLIPYLVPDPLVADPPVHLDEVLNAPDDDPLDSGPPPDPETVLRPEDPNGPTSAAD